MNNTLKINSTPSTLLIIFFVFIGVIIMNCAIAQQNSKNKFLIESILYHNNSSTDWVLRECFYNNENKLIKIAVAGQSGELKFEYENGRVSKIILRDPTMPMFDYDTYFFYNSQGQLIRSEEYQDEWMLQHLNYHYKDGLMVSTYRDGVLPFQSDSLFYDMSGNVIRRSFYQGGSLWTSEYYEYDNNPKPSYGLDYLFTYPPPPRDGTADFNLAVGLSQNNMTKAYISKPNAPFYKFNYTYNEHGLPNTIKTMFIDPEYDFVFSYTISITYKQVEVGISEPKQELADVKVYPNPTTGQLIIENGELKINNVEIFDVYGRKVEGVKERRSEGVKEVILDISGLSAGIYFVKITTEKGVAVKKVVKH